MGHTVTEETKAKMSANRPKNPVTSREILESYDDGTQLVEFVSYAFATEAERKTKVTQTNITKCCLEKRKSAGGRFWHFTKEGDLVGKHRVDNIKVKPPPNARTVISTSPAPERKKQRHEGGCAAGRTLSKSTGKKFSQTKISACCNGKRTHHHGYTFCFESDEAENKNTKKRKRN